MRGAMGRKTKRVIFIAVCVAIMAVSFPLVYSLGVMALTSDALVKVPFTPFYFAKVDEHNEVVDIVTRYMSARGWQFDGYAGNSIYFRGGERYQDEMVFDEGKVIVIVRNGKWVFGT